MCRSWTRKLPGKCNEQQFTHHPELPGLGYAFFENYVNGERLIGHGGDIGTYSSQMILHPEDNLGSIRHVQRIQ